MNTGTYFDQEFILENDRVRLEPLTEKHFELLLPVAMNKELWEFTGAKVTDEADFLRYFNTALTEKKTGHAYPFAIFDKQYDRYAGSTRYGNISFPKKGLKLAGPGTTLTCNVPV